MKTLRFFALATAAVAALMSCDHQGEDGYDGTNYIYLSTEGATSIFESDKEPIVVDIKLTTALKEDLTLDFIVNDSDGIVRLEGNPVTIKAGEKTASFEIFSNNSSQLIEASVYNVTLAESVVLPENTELDKGFSFTVNPTPDMALTDEQKQIIEAYKTKTGIDLRKYLGFVSLTGTYVASNPNSEVINPADTRELKGTTLIMLSEDATADNPVLKMLSNPMGIQDVMYEKLRTITVENDDWYDKEFAPNNALLLEKTGWTKDSEEIFSMSLDVIKLNPDSSVEFVGTGLNSYDEEIAIVPFRYSFTAYDRELAAIENGEIGPAYDPDWSTDVTLNPAYHLNCDDISEDVYGYVDEEAPESSYDGNWVEASATISDDELKFTFCMYHSVDYVYTKVVATYTPNE